MTPTHVTPQPWHGRLQHPRYATDATYQVAAGWLHGCSSVADWGGGPGYLRNWLPADVQYINVDGTTQFGGPDVLADLRTYRGVTEGILLRHVLDMTEDWEAILRNALECFTKRMVVVTFTPDADATAVVKQKSGWPLRQFNPKDLRRAMGALLVMEEPIHTSHPERVYYLERGR